MPEINFMSNHNHCEDSNFRMRDCIIKAEDIVNRAVELGYNGVSITDHETLSAHIRILQRYLDLKKLKEKYDSLSEEEREKDKDLKKEEKLLKNMKQDFKLGLGNEIYLVNSLEEVRDNYVSGETKFWHFILIAKNAKGYEQLKRISSESAWKNWYKNGKMERVPTIKKELEEIVGEEKGNLIAQSACLGGEVATLMVKYFKYGDQQAKLKLHNFITWCIDLFGKENFYLEMQPTFGKSTENILDTEDQVIVNMNIPKLAKAYGINYVVTTDSHYLKKEHRGVHEAFLKAEDSEKSQERELGDFYKYTYMMDMEEIKEALSGHLSEEEVQGAFEGTMKVHEQIEDIVLAHDVIVPEDKNIESFEVKHLFKDWYDKYEYINNYAHSKEKQDLYLLFMIERGFLEKKQEFTEKNISRINTELGTLWQVSERLEQPLSRYYNLVRGLIHEIMWKISYVGIARGSVTGFYICYLISITQINPLKYGLAEWRHLHPSRPELPKQYWALVVNHANGCAE